MKKRRSYVCVVLMLILCQVMAGCGESEKELYEKALNAYNSMDYETAKELFGELGDYKDSANYVELCSNEMAEVSDDNNTEVFDVVEDTKDYMELAIKAYDEKKYEEALELFEQAPEEYAKKSKYLLQIAREFIAREKSAEAQEVIDSIRKSSKVDAYELQMSLKYSLYEENLYNLSDDYLFAWGYTANFAPSV